MLPNPVTASNGTATVAFDYRGSTPDNSQYKDAAASLDQPHTFEAKHTVSKKGSVNQLRRSAYIINRTVEDSLGNQGVLSCYLVINVPEKVATTTQVTEQITLMKNILSVSGVIAKFAAADI